MDQECCNSCLLSVGRALVIQMQLFFSNVVTDCSCVRTFVHFNLQI